jgi:hypothetical protein
MKMFGSWLATTLTLTFLTGVSFAAFADDTSDPDKVKPMFEDGKFKCSDGYDPDTDASLHPPNQNPRTRALVNAQAQDKHERDISGEASKAPEAEGKSDAAASGKPTAVDDVKVDADKEKEKEKEKKDKDKEKKDKDKDRTQSGKKDKTAEGEKDQKAEAEKAAAEKTAAEKATKEKEAAAKADNNPLNKALFAMQTKKYQNSIDILNALLAKDANNAQAHYLLAVSYVQLRKYPEATEQYNIVMKLGKANPAANAQLSQRAEQGLKRISGSAAK